MKDTIITAQRKKYELITLLTCFLIANIINLYSIISFKTSYAELITSLGYVLVATAVIYIGWSIIRVIFYGITRLFRKNK